MAEIHLDITLQPKQKLLLDTILTTGEDSPSVIGFGGARGAAKSGGVRRIALQLAISSPCIIWIIRRVWDDLNKDHVLPLWDEYPDLKQFWHAGEKKLVIPLGAGKTSTIFFIHAGVGGRAKRKSRGPAARYIFLEQAEEFTQEEMEQLAGSNREKGVGPGVCKRIYTFNPGGIGTAYLRRIMHLREYMDKEVAGDFLFIQGFGWDNYEWFRFLGIGAEEFYALPEQVRFEMFIERTDFGRKLNQLPPAQRIGELMGSFDQFGGQYYIDVWEQSTCVLDPATVARIVQPWWVRWLATDWGFSHYAATGWATSGVLAPSAVLQMFGVECSTPIRIIIVYREFVCRDTAEPDLAAAIAKLTPETERREVKNYWLSPDAWAKRGGGNTVQEQIQAVITREGLPEIQPARTDRVGGWRLLYNCWAMARKLRNWSGPIAFEQRAEDPPCLFISANCPEIVKAVPMLICDEKDPTDIRKIPGAVEDDVADMCFVADTMIACDHGDLPISEVHVGDLVWTRNGLRMVTKAWCSGSKPVVLAEFDNGTTTTSTSNHRFFTRNRGFSALDTLRYCDKLVTWNQLYTEAVSTPSYRVVISAALGGFCIAKSGKTRMGQSLTDTKFTTSTGTRETTNYPISDASAQKIIEFFIPRKQTWSTWIEFALWLWRGIGRKRVASGTETTRGESGLANSLWWFCCAVSAVFRSVLAKGDSALINANPGTGDNQEKTTKPADAKTVERNSRPGNTQHKRRADVYAVRLCGLRAAGFADVYDLEVEGDHEFFANGILVHNCRYLIKSYLDAAPHPPDDVVRRQVYDSYQDPTSRVMAMRKLEAEQSKGRVLQRRGRA